MSLINYAQTGNIEEIRKMIKNGKLKKEDIMMKDNNGRTALYWASYYGHLEIVKLLIEKGNLQKEDIMMKDNSGQTAYSVAKIQSIKQLFNNILFNGSINDMIKDIQQSTTLLCDIK